MSRFISFKCDEDLYIDFYTLCNQKGKSLSQCLREAMKMYINANVETTNTIKVEKMKKLW